MDQEKSNRRRTSLTKKQLETELGAELLSLCQSVTADGQLTADEVADLRTWVAEHDSDELPAISHIRAVLQRVLADGKVTPDEMAEVLKAVESVLPPDLRKGATSARREREKADRDRDRSVGWANFMVAGVRHEGRPETIRRHVSPDDPAILQRDIENRYSRNAIAVYTASGHHVGFMPDDEAQAWAGEMDSGTQVRATFTKVLVGGRSPIPVVHAKFYRPEAQLGQDPAANVLLVPASIRQPGGETMAGVAAGFAGFVLKVALGVVASLLLIRCALT